MMFKAMLSKLLVHAHRTYVNGMEVCGHDSFHTMMDRTTWISLKYSDGDPEYPDQIELKDQELTVDDQGIAAVYAHPVEGAVKGRVRSFKLTFTRDRPINEGDLK